MVLTDGTRIELCLGHCYGTLDYYQYTNMHSNIIEIAKGLYESNWRDCNLQMGAHLDTSIVIETELTSPISIKELVLPEGTTLFHAWYGVTIERGVYLPISVTLVDIPINVTILNIADFAHNDAKITFSTSRLIS